MVVGSPGAGKSAVAQRLGILNKVPVHHLDALYFRPGWVDQNEHTWRDTVEAITAGEEWVIDGNFFDSLRARAARADAIVWLDYDRFETLRRVAARMILPQPSPRADLPTGCTESWSVDFLIASWKFFDVQRFELETIMASLPKATAVLRITRPKDLAFFLKRLSERLQLKRREGPT
jgi:adenylate kinase family enzyme